MDLLSSQENVSFDGFVMIPRSHQHAIDTQQRDGLTQRFNLRNIGIFKDRGISGDMVSEALSFLNHSHGFVKYPFAVTNQVVSVTHPVEVNIEREAFVRGNLSENLGVQQKSVGAEEDVAPPLDNPLNQLFQLRINCRL